MANKPGEIYIPANAEEIRDQFLTDIRLGAIDAGDPDPPVQPKTDWWILGTAVANIALLQFANIRISEDDANVLVAEGEPLDELRKAYGLPEVKATGASGEVLVSVTGGGTVTLVNGQQGILPNGLRIEVDGAHIGVSDEAPIAVKAVDTGIQTNLAANKQIRWVTPPVNVETEALVSSAKPLTGGTEQESDARKRTRILNRLQNLPAGGNWGYVREKALNALGSIQDAFIYPALGGPASMKVVLVKETVPKLLDFSRSPSLSAVSTVRNAIHSVMPTEVEIVVQAVADAAAEDTLLVTIPDSSLAGGNGQGWVDATVWPALEVADGGRVLVTVVTSTTQITVGANTAVAPVAGQTHIAWWSATDQKFYKRLVITQSGSAGAWVLTLDQPLVDSQNNPVAVNDYVCPQAVNMDGYAKTWREMFKQLAPQENTADAWRLPRANRHPLVADGLPINFTQSQLGSFSLVHAEVTDSGFGYADTLATAAGSVTTAPSIKAPGKFGVYKQ